MMEKNVQQLFDLAKDQAPQTSVNEVSAWVDKALINVGFLAALKVLLTKKLIMISTTLTLLTGIGIAVATQMTNPQPNSKPEKRTIVPVAQHSQKKDSLTLQTPETPTNGSPLVAMMTQVNEEIDQKMEVFETILLSPKMLEFSGEKLRPRVLDLTDVNSQSFTEIEANGFVNFKIIQGTEDKVSVNQNDQDKSQISVEVKNGRLELNSASKNDINEVIVTIKELKKLELNGFCETVMEGAFKTEELDIEINGFSKANLKSDASKVELEINGETEVNFEGNTSTLDAEINGFSTVAFQGNFNDSAFEINGECKVIVNGSGTTTDIEINGNSKMLASGFETQTAQIEGNGSSDVDLKVTQSLDVELTGKCEVEIDGEPTITKQQLTGGAKLKL